MTIGITSAALLSAAAALAAMTGSIGCASKERAAGGTIPHAVRPRQTEVEAIPLAITIDDLPFVGPSVRGEPAEQAVGRIASALDRRGVPATGFVVCSRLDPAGVDALRSWTSRHLAIGNHSTTHRALDDVPLPEWIEDVQHCQERLEQITGMAPRYFRYPFLRTGSERRVRDDAARRLSDMGLVRAPVSIDTSEWVLAEPYARAVAAGSDAQAADVVDAYLEHIRLAARHYRRVARSRAGREARQVLLLHANALLADNVDRVLSLLESEGFRFVSLHEALEDPIYGRPDDWVDPVGASWLYRVPPADRDAWSWDRAQQRALMARFGLRPDEPTRIGRALSARPLEGAPAWVITHEEPIPANSLVLIAADGSPVLADTPWTPAATRDLLDWVELRFGRLPVLATISHYHLDAAGGIGALLAAGVPVVASTETARLLAERGGSMQATLARQYGPELTGWTIAAPSHTFRPGDGYTARVGETEVNVIFPGGAHSSDNVVTWFPRERLLFGGCMVKGGDSLGNLDDANLETYAASVAVLRALDPRIVVPGHGDRTDAGQLDNTLRLLDAQHEGGE